MPITAAFVSRSSDRRLGVGDRAPQTSISVSNLPGPQHASFKYLGREVTRCNFWVPPTGSLGVFVTMFSLKVPGHADCNART